MPSWWYTKKSTVYHFIVSPSWPSAGHLHEIRAKRRKRVQGFLAARYRTDEETFEESGSRERKEPPVGEHYRPKPSDNPRLVSVNHPHHGQLAKEVVIPFLKHDPSPLIANPGG